MIDVVGYLISSQNGKTTRACDDCAGEKWFIGNPKTAIERKSASDEGRFIACDICEKNLDEVGYQEHIAEGARSINNLQDLPASTGDVTTDYLSTKGEI